MIQYNTLIYLNERRLSQLYNPNGTINPSSVHIKFNACFDTVLIS